LENLGKALTRVEQRRQNLTAAYIDPEIEITKAEYLEQKKQIDGEIQRIKQEVIRIQAELGRIPTPAELETVEAFTTSVREQLAAQEDLSAQDKRAILDMAHVRTMISTEGKGRVTGWFEAPSDGELSTTCSCCGQQAIAFSIEICDSLS
jgi:hypothetical protein